MSDKTTTARAWQGPVEIPPLVAGASVAGLAGGMIGALNIPAHVYGPLIALGLSALIALPRAFRQAGEPVLLRLAGYLLAVVTVFTVAAGLNAGSASLFAPAPEQVEAPRGQAPVPEHSIFSPWFPPRGD